MKKVILLAGALICMQQVASAQWAGEVRKRNDYRGTEAEGDRASDFEVSGFARDRDEREVRRRKEHDSELNGFDNHDEANQEKRAKKMTRRDRRTWGARKERQDRYRDIEVLMLDLNLAKIQKPVFRGIMTEHQRDVAAIMNNAGIDNQEKNIQLKQVYNLRTKRLRETLTDEQYKKWLRIRDEDDYLKIETPDDY